MEKDRSYRPFAGDSALWQKLNTRCRKRFISIRPGNCSIEDAEDAFQDALIKLSSELYSEVPLEVTGELCAYFYTIYKNQLLDLLRRNGRIAGLYKKAAGFDKCGEFHSWCTDDEPDYRFGLLQKCLEKLTPCERQFIEMSLDPDSKRDDIARSLGLTSAHAASRRKHKILLKMKKIAKQLLEEDESGSYMD
jgi:RNA polymerase sigma factor (sigma-70 family)